jgi:hypothetical protein
VNGFEFAMRMAKQSVEQETVGEAWFVSQMADTLIFGHLAIEIIERFLISHYFRFMIYFQLSINKISVSDDPKRLSEYIGCLSIVNF